MISFSRPALFALHFCLVCAFAYPASAVPKKDDIVSSGEEVAIAFFKTADATPDFDIWAMNTPAYKSIAPLRAAEYIDKEKQRLIVQWRDFDPEEDVVEVAGDVQIELKESIEKDGSEKYTMYILLEQKDLFYYPVKFQDYKFAIIPQHFEKLQIQTLQKEQYQNMSAYFKAGGGSAKLYMQLKPIKAHIDQPYAIDGVDQWALICDIATMSVGAAKSKDIFWNYGADWYVSPVTEDLQELYKAKTEGTSAMPQAMP